MNDKKSQSLHFLSGRWIPLEEASQRALELCKSSNVKFESRKIIFLIDLYGIYFRVTNWMRAKDVPITDGELPSRFAGHLLWDAMRAIRERELKEFHCIGVDFDKLVSQIMLSSLDKAVNVEHVTRLDIRWELFYASSPIEEVRQRLESWPRKAKDRQRALEELTKGVIWTPHGPRDYRIYDEFISELGDWLAAKHSEPGFYGIHMDGSHVSLSEKEVDIRIAVRAMDIMAGGEADSICIVSSDQDYMPLHERVRDAGLTTYQADVAKFSMHENVGRKIRNLEGFITTQVDAGFLEGIIAEHVGSPPMLELSDAQYGALYRHYRELGGQRF